MCLPPPVARSLYSSLLTSANQLQHHLIRFPSLVSREFAALRRISAAPLPTELRGLLDVHIHPHPPPLPLYVSIVARRLAHAATTPQLAGLDARVGFTALKHINSRVDALRHLVYPTASNAQHFGITVEANSTYQGADRQRFFFRYQVRINNQSEEKVQLLSRAWTVRDLDGRVVNVEGPGVVGDFPTLNPSDSYEYSSAMPLATPFGTQSGYYVFIKGDGNQVNPDNVNQSMLHVPVAPFSYRTPTLESKKSSSSTSSKSIGKKKSRRRRST